MKIACVDTETTGADINDGAEVLEIAVTMLVMEPHPNGHRPHQCYHLDYTSSILVGPPPVIPPQSSAIHHITAATYERETFYDKEYAREWLCAEVAGCNAIAAHHAEFDKKFLKLLRDLPWLCTMKIAKHLWPDAPGYSLQCLRYWLDLPDDGVHGVPHRAAYDTACCAHLVARELEEADRRRATPGSRANQPDLVPILFDLSETMPVLKKVHFGKHRGEEWKNVPSDYLGWILKQVSKGEDFDPEVVHTARHYLEARGKL